MVCIFNNIDNFIIYFYKWVLYNCTNKKLKHYIKYNIPSFDIIWKRFGKQYFEDVIRIVRRHNQRHNLQSKYR